MTVPVSAPPPAPVPVLVLRALGLGDALTAVPALRALRRHFADRPLVLAAAGEPPRLLHRLGVVDAIVPTPNLFGRPPAAGLPAALGRAGQAVPHLAVNLHGRGPQSHRLLLAGEPEQLLAYACPAAGVFEGPQWDDDEHEVVRWGRLVASVGARWTPADLRLPVPDGVALPADLEEVTGQGRYVVVHPGAAFAGRRWPPDRWARVCAVLAAAGHRVLLTGGGEEQELVAAVAQDAGLPPAASTAGALSLEQLVVLVSGASLLLCGDTGVAHVGTALGTPSVLLFGPVPPAAWQPLVDLDRHVVLWHGTDRGDPHAELLDPALAKIDTGEVLDAAFHLLS